MLRCSYWLTVVLFSLSVHCATQGQERFRVYLGTYTDDGSQGIYHCEFNAHDGSLSPVKLAGKTNSPTFLAFHPNEKFIYAVDPDSFELSPLDTRRPESKHHAISPSIRQDDSCWSQISRAGMSASFASISATGELIPTEAKTQIANPVCVRFMKL
ncbi:MAG: beta-propeller fold lactonase family protein [Pirellulaceae bacterium]